MRTPRIKFSLALDAPAGRVTGSCPSVETWSRLLPGRAISGCFFRGCVHLQGSKRNCRFQLDRSGRVDNEGSSNGTHIVRNSGNDNNVGTRRFSSSNQHVWFIHGNRPYPSFGPLNRISFRESPWLNTRSNPYFGGVLNRLPQSFSPIQAHGFPGRPCVCKNKCCAWIDFFLDKKRGKSENVIANELQ